MQQANKPENNDHFELNLLLYNVRLALCSIIHPVMS